MASALSVFAIFYDANPLGFQGSPYRELRQCLGLISAAWLRDADTYPR